MFIVKLTGDACAAACGRSCRPPSPRRRRGTWPSCVLPDGRPSFASIAAVICLGASHGQRGSKALQLVAASCSASAWRRCWCADRRRAAADRPDGRAGDGAAVLLGGGELLTAEAAVSAILIVSLDPGASDAFTVNRILEGVIGGGVALAVSSLLFPADPALPVARAAQAVFAGLGRALERLAGGRRRGDARRGRRGARRGARARRGTSPRSTRRSRSAARPPACPRGGAPSWPSSTATRASFAQVDYAIRDTRVLARHSVRGAALRRAGAETLAEAVRELGSLRLVARRRLRQPDEIIGAARARAARRLARGRHDARGHRARCARRRSTCAAPPIWSATPRSRTRARRPRNCSSRRSTNLLLTKVRDMDGVAQVRSFNRTVTERVGALEDSFLGPRAPTRCSRVLWEIGDGADVRELRARLGLDSGYLSRAAARAGERRLGRGRARRRRTGACAASRRTATGHAERRGTRPSQRRARGLAAGATRATSSARLRRRDGRVERLLTAGWSRSPSATDE